MKTKVTVTDKMQKKYIYFLTEPIGKNFDPEFNPQLTPKQMLTLGIFGGIYMRDCAKEFPQDWFTKAKFARENIQDPKLNYFKIKASQSLAEWRRKGWIYEEDPRGWFQWYCRYYMGRRIEKEDKRQIKRWRMMRQALLHWAYDTR